jgi:transcriptional regulator of acetoin/glycerol metabolism
MIARQEFREDLFYRLNGLAVRLPPLRERSDLMALVRRILDRECPGRRLQLSGEAVQLFEHYTWPGNVRQLFNVLRTAAVMAGSDPVITTLHLSDDFVEDARAQLVRSRGAEAMPASIAPPVAAAGTAASGSRTATADPAPPAQAALAPATAAAAAPPPTMSLDEMEIDAIRRAVESCGGNISEASKQLGISRNTIYRKLRWNTAK